MHLHDTLHVQGLAAIGEKLQKLSDNVQEKVAAVAMRAASEAGLGGVMSEVPQRTGNLYRHLRRARRMRGVPKSQVTYIVFVKTGGRKTTQGTGKRGKGSRASMPDAYYWFFVEFGTSKMKANPFMLRGFLKSAQAAAERAREFADYSLRNLMA